MTAAQQNAPRVQAAPGTPATPGGVAQAPVNGTLQKDPLAELRDLHLPDPVGMWPPAPGWWFAGAVTLALVGAALWSAWRHWQRNRYRREAVRQLEALLTHSRNSDDPRAYLVGCAQLLKRVALLHHDRRAVAPLTGEQWVAFLDRTGHTTEFTLGAGEALIEGPYSARTRFDLDALHGVAVRWLREHDIPQGTRGRLRWRRSVPAAESPA